MDAPQPGRGDTTLPQTERDKKAYDEITSGKTSDVTGSGGAANAPESQGDDQGTGTQSGTSGQGSGSTTGR